jgi:uncharacterized protein with GYD domain
MTSYIMLMSWTDEGMKTAADSPRRLDAAKALLRDMGGEMKAFYMTMGEYDMVVVFEASDDAIAARFALLLGRGGAVRSKTLKAFPEPAYREIMASLQ